MKQVLKRVLKKWYIYVVGVILASVVSVYFVHFVSMPRNEATISIFLTSNNETKKKVFDILDDVKPSYLKEIDITNVEANNTEFGYYFAQKGLNKADIFVLPESKLTDEMLSKQFATLDQEYLSTYFTYTSEQTNHGILLHEKDKEDTLFNLKEELEENYYIFFRKNSIHCGMLNNSNFDTSIIFTKALLNYEI